MKRCSKCGHDKGLESFARNRASSDGRGTWCRDCFREYDRVRYQAKGPGTWRSQVQAGNRRSREKRKRWVYDYLSSHPCVDCGEGDPIVLEFDHVRGIKLFTIGKMVHSATWKSILAEVAKCDVRCANCHKRRTASQFGWYASLTQPVMKPMRPLPLGVGL